MCFFECEFQKNNLNGQNLDFENKKRNITEEMKNLLNQMLKFNPGHRITFEQLFQHKFFSVQLGRDMENLKHLKSLKVMMMMKLKEQYQ